MMDQKIILVILRKNMCRNITMSIYFPIQMRVYLWRAIVACRWPKENT